ncbi:MAG: electron transfer flavoprotein-ubiquinone oxidoreductase [Pseudomonadota bacterium]|nr:electron transfer flavoprotein-ubiquinone oxidoreductase [Pseudomonadota bacterium]
MNFDVLIIGAGPSGLSTAIKLAQLTGALAQPLSICVLEKGAEVGAHIVSGCVLEPRALNELWPSWQKSQHPLKTKAKKDKFYMLSQRRAWRLPNPPQMNNHGNYIVSLSKVCRWLADEAERLGVMVIPGYAAQEPIFDDGVLVGVKTGDMGRQKDGSAGPGFQPGVSIYAKQTVLAEGCRGSLSEIIMKKYHLRTGKQPQTYAIGVKEVWQVDDSVYQEGHILHTVGWPLKNDTYGGSFLYHYEGDKIALGFVIGLDYTNPTLDAHAELQRYKHHPLIEPLLQKGTRIAYASRALNEGGWQAVPTCYFPGGLLVGCAAGFLNVPKIKGVHTAMKSGILAAEAVAAHIQGVQLEQLGKNYESRLKQSWMMRELKQCRNIRPGFYRGLWVGLANAALETITFGKLPWTLSLREDHNRLKPLKAIKPITYPKPDGKISFRKLDSVRLTGTNHAENQPCHLKIKNDKTPIKINYKIYGGPESYYCPAAVYEYVKIDGRVVFQINAQNCIHCKTCDIKDPTQNIQWVPPQGGEGPRYSDT